MPNTKLLTFGNPKSGTPLMLASPSIAIDLALKILVAEDQGKVWISYNSYESLKERHSQPQDLVQNIAVVETLGPTQPSSCHHGEEVNCSYDEA